MPKGWRSYPDSIQTYGYDGPNKTRWTLRSELEHRRWSDEYKQRIYKEGLQYSCEWKRVLRLCDIRPYQRNSPTLDLDGNVISKISEYISTSISHLEKATNAVWEKCSPESLYHLPRSYKHKLVKLMVHEAKGVNTNKSC